MRVISESPTETKKFAYTFASFLKGGEVLALVGNLGSGKTTFIKGLKKGLGIKDKITSPTFVLINSYRIQGEKPKIFYHLDLYRLKRTRELIELGLTEILEGHQNIVAIEWPKKARRFLPPYTIFLKFTHGKKPNQRIIVFQ